MIVHLYKIDTIYTYFFIVAMINLICVNQMSLSGNFKSIPNRDKVRSFVYIRSILAINSWTTIRSQRVPLLYNDLSFFFYAGA